MLARRRRKGLRLEAAGGLDMLCPVGDQRARGCFAFREYCRKGYVLVDRDGQDHGGRRSNRSRERHDYRKKRKILQRKRAVEFLVLKTHDDPLVQAAVL
jgi:hypothetical protein